MVALRKTSSVALVLLSLGCATTPPVHGHGCLGRPEPEVHLPDGTTVPWPSLLAPQGTTVVVFATLWCEICRRERPAVEAWARAHQPSLRTVYVFSGGELPKAIEQIQALHLDTAALTIVVDADGQLADRYGIQSTPTLLVLGAQGQVLSTVHRFASLGLD
jgi:thiol-disulfide isomerase/thioredoxin